MTVPAATLFVPHWLLVQVRVWHAVSLPGQSLAVRQPTQAPAPLQSRLAPQLVPEATGTCEGAPDVHTSVVQALPSFGLSVSSVTTTTAPAPLHWLFLQSPLTCAMTAVPAVVLL